MPPLPNYPEFFTRRERALLGARFEELLTPALPIREAPARGVTVNTLRCAPEAFAAGMDIPLAPSPFCRQAFAVPADFRPGRHPWHHAGVFYAQEPSAAGAAPLLDVRPGMRVCDLCAAPGGKSSQLAAALAGQGLLLANEYVPARAEILRQNLERMGVTNAVVTNETPGRLADALPGWFDRVLVDAPCSGEGMFRKEPAAIAQHSPALVAQCAATAAGILDAAARLLAPGGVLVLSTCTFAPEEDEAQAAAFLARHPEFVQEDLSAAGFGRPGEADRAPETPGFAAAYCRRIWPADGGEGHFIARFPQAGRAAAPPGECPGQNERPGQSRPPGQGRRPGAGRLARLCGRIFPRPGRRPGGHCRRPGRAAPAGGAARGKAAHPAGGRAGRQAAKRPLCAKPRAVYGPRRGVRQRRAPDPGRPPHRGLAARRGDRGQNRPARLVRRAGGRLPAGLRQSQRRPGQKPLPQGPAQPGMNRPHPPINSIQQAPAQSLLQTVPVLFLRIFCRIGRTACRAGAACGQ